MKYSKIITTFCGALLPSGAILMGILVLVSIMATSSVQAQSVSPTGMSRERTMLSNQIRTLKNAFRSKTNKLQEGIDVNAEEINKLTPPDNLCNGADQVLSYNNGWICKTITAVESGTKSGKPCDTKTFTFNQTINYTTSGRQRKSSTSTCRYILLKTADKELRTPVVKNITPNVCAVLARDTKYMGSGTSGTKYTGATWSGTANAQCVNGTWNVINKGSCGCAGSYVAKIDRSNEH